MNTTDKFCLKWSQFAENISQSYKEMREESTFFDVTLACDDDFQIEAHKVVLSASSTFFKNVLKRNQVLASTSSSRCRFQIRWCFGVDDAHDTGQVDSNMQML